MATLTHALETLRSRRSHGERPVVSVGGSDHEFAGGGGSRLMKWDIHIYDPRTQIVGVDEIGPPRSPHAWLRRSR